jgi:hypothetical protein
MGLGSNIAMCSLWATCPQGAITVSFKLRHYPFARGLDGIAQPCYISGRDVTGCLACRARTQLLHRTLGLVRDGEKFSRRGALYESANAWFPDGPPILGSSPSLRALLKPAVCSVCGVESRHAGEEVVSGGSTAGFAM